MEITESEYKYNLAVDLIYYLMANLINNHPNKIEMINDILKKWDRRVNNNLRNSLIEKSKKYAKDNDVTDDVAAILFSAHQQEHLILKKEFKDKIAQVLINTMLQFEKGK